ncbi:hypothetical protein PV05_07848 [Exophiala xenobiotica]|uniref:Methyltransferase type 11 domain-containing protein n=1 Tax=Exophiala xenobiotica TaxID=348802 RepID=A0A0D2CQD0_9EURO|nr:uncharacterized protein PV05_07848 [Exophiala xenobiotica]KIW52187.1 hypothetical protein PV05_07848 [Exophiala xenobiotica]
MATTLDCLMDYLFPVPFLTISIFYFALAFLKHPLLPLTNFESFKEKAFAGLWLQFGAAFAEQTPPQISTLLAQSKGVILDVGPGSGEQLHRFSQPQNITAIYGVEPGVTLHDKLRESAGEVGLGDKYHVISATADLDSILPGLVKAGLLKSNEVSAPEDLQLFDEIVCIRVLCGVPDLRSSVADLYGLLKPGGRFVVCEHVMNSKSTAANLVQRFWMLVGWKRLMGGCELTRDTLQAMLEVANEKDGGFAKVEIKQVDEHSMITHIVGVLTKK